MINLNASEFKKLIPYYVINIAEELQKNNYEAYLVGGSIRDILLGKVPEDFDVATNANPEALTKIFPKSVPTGAKFGTITVIGVDDTGERFDVEVTTYRSEADYVGGRWPTKVEYAKTIQEDLSRRDFTINAVALDLQHFDESDVQISHIVVDPFKGLDDLNTKLLKAVGNPTERLTEDGLRAVRACRLASQLDFEIDPATFDAIKQTLHVTKMVSVERFRDELMKLLLKSPMPSKGLGLLKDSGILELFIPELIEGIGVVQPKFHVDDVFEHLIKTVDIAEDSVKLAALFHDIAKPRTESQDERGIHFYGHDVKSAEMTSEIMRRLKFSNQEIERTARLIRWHMFYYPSAEYRKQAPSPLEPIPQEEGDKGGGGSRAGGWSDAAIRRFIQNVGGEDAIDDLMKLRIADAAANPKSEFNPKELDILSARIADVRAKEMALKIEDLDITGHDLMENFGLQPGPVLGQVLKYLLDKVIEDPGFNKKLDLLRLASEFLEKQSKKEELKP